MAHSWADADVGFFSGLGVRLIFFRRRAFNDILWRSFGCVGHGGEGQGGLQIGKLKAERFDQKNNRSWNHRVVIVGQPEHSWSLSFPFTLQISRYG